MAEIVDTPAQAAELELAPLIVREPLEAYLDAQGLGSGRLEVERIGEGHSNITYLVTRGDARFVLRRPPRPPLPPSAHDVLREARLLSALEPTAARTPRVLAACDDESILGVPFYVMEEMKGDVITSRHPRARSTTRRSGAGSATSWWTRSWRCTRWTGRRPAWRASASRPATSTASCGASTGCGSTTRRASCRSCRRWPTGSSTTSPSPRPPRSCTATTASATRWWPPTRPGG